MLWRRYNDYLELIEIVKLMDFLNEKRVGVYNSPFKNRKYPVDISFDKFVDGLTDAPEGGNYLDGMTDAPEIMTKRISNWVSHNCPYDSKYGHYKTQFNKAKDAYYYYKRLDKYD